MSADGKKIGRAAVRFGALIVIIFVAYHAGHFIGGEAVKIIRN